MNEAVLQRALDAEGAAERELGSIPDWLWDGAGLPVPIDILADSHYGLLVREGENLSSLVGLQSDGQVSGLLLPGPREIWVDAGEADRAPNRRRFTIGHELGHWVLHCESGGRDGAVVHCRDVSVHEEGAVSDGRGASHLADLGDYPPRELDANQFSAALLMPAALVGTERKRWGDDVEDLAREFQVSGVAMEKRLWFLDQVGKRR